MLVVIAAIFIFRIFSTYVNLACLKSAEKLHHDIFIRTNAEFNVRQYELVKLLKSLYVLSERRYYWDRTFRCHLGDDLGMKSCISDAALFYEQLRRELDWSYASYVDDKLQAETQFYEQLCKKIEATFRCKKRKYNPVQLAGLYVKHKEDIFVIHQNTYTF